MPSNRHHTFPTTDTRCPSHPGGALLRPIRVLLFHLLPSIRKVHRAASLATLGLICLTAACALSGCSSPLPHRAERAYGLLDFLFGNPGETTVPVEIIGSGRGQIETAQVRAYGDKVYVTGYVRRVAPGDPHPGAHVDVIVVDAGHKVVETKVASYLPRSIPHGQRSGFAHSSYTVRLAALPPPGAAVKVSFHNSPARTCDFNRAFAAR